MKVSIHKITEFKVAVASQCVYNTLIRGVHYFEEAMASYPIKLSHVILILSFETLAADLFCSATTRIEYLEEHIQSQS